MKYLLRAAEKCVQKQLDEVNQDLVRVMRVEAYNNTSLLVEFEFYVRGTLGYDGHSFTYVLIHEILAEALTIAIDEEN